MPSLGSSCIFPTKVAFRTIGCKLNQCETAQMQEALTASGYELVGWQDRADVRVVNTCTVTAKSDSTCRREIRLAKRLDPKCVVAVTGCYAQVDPDAVAAIPGVDLVLGNLEKLRLGDHLARLNGGLPVTSFGGCLPVTSVGGFAERPAFEDEFVSHFYGYTRAFLKIQTGCDSRCSYCVIPAARGPARSMRSAMVLEQIRLLTARDYREVVLTGINLGTWGRDSGEGSLSDLLETLAANEPAMRYRLSSVEPMDIDRPLLETIKRMGERVAHHFHLPLQSGADAVLRRMDRPYTAADYHRVVEAVASAFPDAAIGADVIAGFPGETDEEFGQTCRLIEDSALTYLHVFSYSDRPGTAASAMKDKVAPETIHARNLLLRRLGERKNSAFRQRIRGREERALVLKERADDGRLIGLTGNYQEVLVPGDDRLMNRFLRVGLEAVLADGRWSAAVRAGQDGAA